MLFESTSAPHVCRNCLRNFYNRPRALQSTSSSFTKQWQARDLRTRARLSKPKEGAVNITRYNSPNKKHRTPAWQSVEAAIEHKKTLAIKEEKNEAPLDRSQKKELFMTHRVKPEVDKSKLEQARRERSRIMEEERSKLVHKHPIYTVREKKKMKAETRQIPGKAGVLDKPAHSHTEMVKINLNTSADYSWYWETIAPTWQQLSRVNIFFKQQTTPKFLTSVSHFRNFPESDVPEVAFVGRSNVGKSSLINAIVNATVARSSATRGFTKTMNLYGIAAKAGISLQETDTGHKKVGGTGGLTIVDTPGYGQGSISSWGTEILKYMQNRKQLRRVFVLLDISHGIKEKDQSLLSTLTVCGIPYQVVLVKLDRLYIPQGKSSMVMRSDNRKLKKKGSPSALSETMADFRRKIQPEAHGAGALGELLACSAEAMVDGKGLGIDAVRFAVLQAAGLTLGVQGKVRSNLVRSI